MPEDPTAQNNTRFDIERDPRNPVDHLSSGYEGSSPTDGFTIPSCSLDDVDQAVQDLFENKVGFRTAVIPDSAIGQDVHINKPYVIFATGERFALVKKLRPPRDKSKQLMLPAISIRRKSVQQTSADLTGRGINQATGDLVIKTRLSAEDRGYQALLNKLGLELPLPGPLRSHQGENSLDADVVEGALLSSKLKNNIWEIISIPQPQFFTATYEVTFWTSYTQHMTYLITSLLSAQLPQGKDFRLNTPSGYWFIGTIGDEFTSAENYDDFAEEKRIIRYTFQLSVKSFVLAPNGPGMPVPVKRTLSAVTIDFVMSESSGQVQPPGTHAVVADPFVLSDIERDPKKAQTSTVTDRLLVQKQVWNPRTNRFVQKYVKTLTPSQKRGETVYYTSGFETLDEIVESIKGK